MAPAARSTNSPHRSQRACALCPECGEWYSTVGLDIPGVSFVFFHACAGGSVSRRSTRTGDRGLTRGGTKVPPS